jgi:anthranilate phosphoribosyltransferase
MIREALQKVMDRNDLTRPEAFSVMEFIMDGKATPAQIAAFLIAMKMKGETAQEIAGFAASMRGKAQKVHTNGYTNAVDLVGTGGDKSYTFNISTVAAFVVAGCGIPVAKHGNRSVSSKCGSADVLAALGINLNLDADQLSNCLQKTGIAFLFAPVLHPAMKQAVSPRKEIGVRTFFNILGPITNPAGVKRQLIGVFNLETAKLLADVLRQLEADHVLLVHSEDGLDEISLKSKTYVIELINGKIIEYQINAADFGLEPTSKEITGGDATENAEIANQILQGKKGPARDVVVMNAAAGIYVSGRTSNFKEAARLAMNSLDSGAAYGKLEAMRTFSKQFN